MKRSLDRLSVVASDNGGSDEVFARQVKKYQLAASSSSSSANSRAATPTPTSDAAVLPTSSDATLACAQLQSCPASPAQPLALIQELPRRRDCDLHVHLKEEGIIRQIFAFLDVRDHQLIRGCCRGWKQLVQTLDLDVLDMSRASPLTPATIDRAFLSVIHSYSRVLHLNLSGQRSLNDRDLLVLASCFWSNLERISFDDCLDVTDFGLLSVLNAQSLKLKSVSMRHCKQITGSFARHQITGRHPSLAALDLDDTRVGLQFVTDLDAAFPSLQQIHALHTPAHLEFFQRHKWQDLVDDLAFLVMNEMVDLPHLQGLLAEFAFRAKALLSTVAAPMSSSHSTDEATDCGGAIFARTLLSEGTRALMNVPLQRGDWTSALLFACDNGLVNVIPELLVCGGTDVAVTDKDGATPLSVAATNGLTEAVEALLRAGADINARTHCLATPLYIASEMNFDDIVDLLLRSGARTECSIVGGATALCVAAKNGNRATVARLLAAAARRSARPTGASPATSLLHGAQTLPRDQMQFVQALFLACERGHADIVGDILAHRGMSANVLMDSSVTPLYLACQMGHDDIVELLLQRGANPNFRRPSGGVSCLYIAAQEGKHRIVERLVQHRVNIHARMEDLSTALHIAARMGHLAVARVLLREGACVDDQTRSGLTALYIACEEGHVAIAQFLLSQRAALDRQTKNGTTPLFVASQKGHAAVVRALLAAGADAQRAKSNGTCPLDAAALLGNVEVTQLLLQFGARVGGLALHFAERRRDRKLQALLMDRYYSQHFLAPPEDAESAAAAAAIAATLRPL